MAIGNFTGDEKRKLYGELYCSLELSRGIHDHLICFTVVHSLLSLTAFLGNTLILVALHKESSLHPPSKLLFRNLATTDLCVGIIAEPLWVAYLIFAVNEQWGICRYTSAIIHITSYILCSVSLFTLTAISVDRLLALLLGLRYRQVVTLRKISLTLILSWTVSAFASTAYLWNHQINSWFSYIAASLCLITSIFVYAKIFLSLRHNQVHAHGNAHTMSMNLARYRKTVSTALLVQLALLVCYLPHGFVEVFVHQRELSPSVSVARLYSTTLILLNSSLNPILYCWKIREVRQAVKDTIRGLFSSSS